MPVLNQPSFKITEGKSFDLSKQATSFPTNLAPENIAKIQKKANKKLRKLQQKLYASDNHAVLIIFQAMDAAGKDSTIRSVFSGLDPAGFVTSSFKAPSKNELDHDFLWRCNKRIPDRGRIGIFNRSHYEEVLVCKVHPNFVLGQNIPGITSMEHLNDEFWNSRYGSISAWEKHLALSGTKIIKFFLNVGKDEQKARFLSRINEEKKNWKFNFGDMRERALWPKYMEAYQSAIQNTAKPYAPWYVIPADRKDVMRAMVSEILVQELDSLNLKYPVVGQKEKDEMKEAKEILENEA